MDDPRVELALLRVSANVSRITHLLRAAGPDIDVSLLDAFDAGQRVALGSLLGGSLSERVWLQASGAAAEGGLGLRSARELQYPAFLASRAEARPLVEDLTSSLPSLWRDSLLNQWPWSVDAAAEAWANELPQSAAQVAQQLLEAGAAEAACRAAQLAGHLPRSRAGDGAEFARSVSSSLLTGVDDPEHPDAAEGLQARLAALAARPRLERLRGQ